MRHHGVGRILSGHETSARLRPSAALRRSRSAIAKVSQGGVLRLAWSLICFLIVLFQGRFGFEPVFYHVSHDDSFLCRGQSVPVHLAEYMMQSAESTVYVRNDLFYGHRRILHHRSCLIYGVFPYRYLCLRQKRSKCHAHDGTDPRVGRNRTGTRGAPDKAVHPVPQKSAHDGSDK